MEDLKSFPWFHGCIAREVAEKRLANLGLKDGLFLMRESTRTPGSLVLTLCNEGKVHNFKVNKKAFGDDSNLYFLDNGPTFVSVEKLIAFYRTPLEENPVRLQNHCPNKDISNSIPAKGRRQNYEVVWLATSSTTKKEESNPADTLAAELDQVALEGTDAKMAADEDRRRLMSNFRRSKKAILETADVEGLEDKLTENPDSKTKKFDSRQKSFKISAHTEKQVYLKWINEHLDNPINNLDEDIKGAVSIIKVMERISGQSAPPYSPRPITPVQMSDNWHVAVKFMKILQISEQDFEFSSLAKLDEREILKLFSRLLTWESTKKSQ